MFQVYKRLRAVADMKPGTLKYVLNPTEDVMLPKTNCLDIIQNICNVHIKGIMPEQLTEKMLSY